MARQARSKQVATVRNPLTVIAIFAGIAEVSGTAVLPLVDPSLQGIFIWFVTGFPCLLVVLFFLTLNFNHAALYAPSDFQEDESFLRAKSRAVVAARTEKLRTELASVEAESLTDVPKREGEPSASTSERTLTARKRNVRARYFLAEELVLNKLAQEIAGEFSRESLVSTGGGPYVFDATVIDGEKMTAIEVKYFPEKVNASIVMNTVRRIDDFYRRMSASEHSGFQFILAIATDAPPAEQVQMVDSVVQLVREFRIPVDVRVFDMNALERELDKVIEDLSAKSNTNVRPRA